MANAYDRFDTESGGSGFMMGLLAGTVVGAGLGMLFASKSGAELRKRLSEQADELANRAREGYRSVTKDAGQWAEKGKEVAGELADRGKEMYGQAREVATRGAEEAQKYVRDAAGTIKSATSSRTSSDPDYWTSGSDGGSRQS